MRTNTDMTIVRRKPDGDGYMTIYIPSAMWQGTHKSNHGENGRYADDRVNIYIPLSSVPSDFIVLVGDMAVRGSVDDVKTSAQYKRLLGRPDVHKVVSASKKDYCSAALRHWSVVCER